MNKGIYRWELIPRGDLLDLCAAKPAPIAYFRDEQAAKSCGAALYGEFYEVSEVQQEAKGE